MSHMFKLRDGGAQSDALSVMAGNAEKQVGQALGLTNPKAIAASFVEKDQLDRWQQMKRSV